MIWKILGSQLRKDFKKIFKIFEEEKCNIISIISMIEELKINVENIKRRHSYDIDGPIVQDEEQNNNQEESKHQIIKDGTNS